MTRSTFTRSGFNKNARASGQREIHAVPEAVGKEQFRNGKSEVVWAQGENVFGVIPCCDQHIRVAMHGGFRRAAAA